MTIPVVTKVHTKWQMIYFSVGLRLIPLLPGAKIPCNELYAEQITGRINRGRWR
jgi:hypothetical protein